MMKKKRFTGLKYLHEKRRKSSEFVLIIKYIKKCYHSQFKTQNL